MFLILQRARYKLLCYYLVTFLLGNLWKFLDAIIYCTSLRFSSVQVSRENGGSPFIRRKIIRVNLKWAKILNIAERWLHCNNFNVAACWWQCFQSCNGLATKCFVITLLLFRWVICGNSWMLSCILHLSSEHKSHEVQFRETYKCKYFLKTT